jgi:hypothetical protein
VEEGLMPMRVENDLAIVVVLGLLDIDIMHVNVYGIEKRRRSYKRRQREKLGEVAIGWSLACD